MKPTAGGQVTAATAVTAGGLSLRALTRTRTVTTFPDLIPTDPARLRATSPFALTNPLASPTSLQITKITQITIGGTSEAAIEDAEEGRHDAEVDHAGNLPLTPLSEPWFLVSPPTFLRSASAI